MKTSIYNYMFSNQNKKYGYNILSTSIIELNDRVFNAINNNELEKLTTNEIDALYDEGFIVDDNAQEADKYRYYYDTVRFTGTASDLRIMFIPTYCCNLRCPYCYEGTNKNFGYISTEALNTILKFIKNEILNSMVPIEKLTISLFGGEPTLLPDALELFCRGVYDIGKEYGIEVFFDITTNFTLVNTRILNLIKEYSIMTQVSIDGAKEMHDSTRITPNGKGTYDLIVQNLEKALEWGLKDFITIRINTDEENLSSCKDVFNTMQKYSNDVYFGILNKYTGKNDGFSGTCMDDQTVVNVYSNNLLKLYKENGLELPVKFGKKNPCSMNSVNKYMIDNYLNVYKCDLLLNIDDYKVGHLDKNGNFIRNENYYKQMSFSPFNNQKCYECKFLPLCAGNCPGEVILKEQLKNGEIPIGYCINKESNLRQYLTSYVSLLENE